MMRKSVVVVSLVLAMVIGAALCVGAEEKFYPAAIAVKAPQAMKIDGKFDEWGKAYPVRVAADDPIVLAYGKTWNKAPEGEALVWAMWDETKLYIFARVTDDKVVGPITDPAQGAPWLDDSIGTFVMFPDGTGFKAPMSATSPDGKPLIGWAPVGPGGATLDPAVADVAVVRTDYGYDMEIAIKWAKVGKFVPKVGSVVRYTPLFMDRDGGADEDNNTVWGQTMWVGDGDNPYVYGYLVFAE